jgi:hypothetical protein
MKVQIKILNKNYDSVVSSITNSVQEINGVLSILPQKETKFYCFEVIFDENVADFEKILKLVQTYEIKKGNNFRIR